jgi:hypothetical protein
MRYNQHCPPRGCLILPATGRFSMRLLFAARLALLLLAVLAPKGRSAPPGEKIDFAADIQPILKARCYKCHGPDKQESGLRLHLKSAAMIGGDNGAAIVAGKSGDSPLARRIAGLGDDPRMPPEDDGPPLPADEIAKIRAWIDQGAAWPESADGINTTGREHWAYKKPIRVPLPPVSRPTWSIGPLDRFILARLDEEKLQPSPEQERARLVRRASLDVIGISPAVQSVDAFLADASPDAYERAVDRLLASPRYGERWAAPWLDRARYADTQGYEKDNRRTIWRYRDWVINALNRNLTFDQFTIEQLAGDLLPNATPDQKLATAFHRNTMTNTEGGTDNEEFRVAAVVDRVNTTWDVWMATTFGCCQCHSHKYDPFTQREYYQFFAFFNHTADADNDNEAPTISTPSAAEERELGKLQSEIAQLERELKSPPPRSENRPQPPEPPTQPDQIDAIKKRIAARKVTTTPVMVELSGKNRRETHLMIRGSFLAKGEKVVEGTPGVLHALPSDLPRNRLGAAQWLVHPDNPLAPRVTMNRLWEQLFGVGIVETSEDFGRQGELPSHPELLDWLAAELITRQWDMKQMLKELVTSASYRQSSAVTPELVRRDPYNRLLARGPRNRLSAEQLRDQALAASGLLSSKMLGPSVMPPQPSGVWQVVYNNEQWLTPSGDDRYRRALYTFWRRSSPYPAMVAFDAPSREYCVVRRSRTNTPLQALVTLNDPAFVEAAQALARRVMTEGGSTITDRVTYAFRRCLSRHPKEAEIARLAALFHSELSHFRQDAAAAKKLVAGALGGSDFDEAEAAAWTIVANVLLNMDETVTKG